MTTSRKNDIRLKIWTVSKIKIKNYLTSLN